MQMVPVASSNLSAVGYDSNTSTLVTSFRNGTTYKYLSVPFSVFERLMSAPSKGAFFNQHIKDRFQFVRLA